MARNASTSLFNLIKRLSDKECDFFIGYNQMHGSDNKYVKLFELIRAQDDYNEAAIQLHLYGKEQKNSKLSALKKYLNILVLNSLSVFYEKDATNIYFNQQLQHVEILLNRGLLEDAQYLLSCLKDKAIQEEGYHTLLAITNLEYHSQLLVLAQGVFIQLPISFTPFFKQVQGIASNRLLFSEIFFKLQKGAIVRDLSLQTSIQKLVNQRQSNEDCSCEQTILEGLILGYGLYILGDFRDLYEQSKTLLEQIKLYEKDLTIDVLYKMSALNNYIMSCINLRYTDKALDYFEILKALPNKPINREELVIKAYYTTYLNIHLQRGTLEEGLVMIQQMFEQAYALILKNTISIQFCCAGIFITLEKYEDALHWLNKITSVKKGKERADLQSLARILTLIVHYELGNHFILDYQVVNHTRFLKMQKRYLAFERFFLRVINAAVKVIEPIPVFKKYYTQFNVLLNDPNNLNIMTGYFDFDMWFRSKLEQKSFKALIEEKNDYLL